MKTIIITALASALTLTALQSQAEENLEVFTEAERIMVLWAPSGNNLGRAHVFTCEQCQPHVMTFDQNTTLRLQGQPALIEELKLKVDWAGLVQSNTAQPDRIISLDLE
ncbi:hypothetical protein [Atopomonas sediminilitoris]|uniref:hypothetical protein n=1 Tax=Atopomonas sediminilitoris TaxID=2919919 RepID=UPI001F4DDAFB|nr:hypothetical protein [Atopomonas sediminilitoris]MCJ8170655.1 hypothetical protein [Atopomonas sediminilitoris]